MDNLYIFAKFLGICFIALSLLVTGVARMGDRGVPGCVKQSEVTKQDEFAFAQGTLKLAQLQDDPEMPNLICTSLYDQKPFYMMSTGQKISLGFGFSRKYGALISQNIAWFLSIGSTLLITTT